MGAIGILALLTLSATADGGPKAPDSATASARLATGLPAELEGATLIDSVVARVNRRPITQSQLELETRLALATHGEVAAAEGPLGEPQLSSALDYLIDQLLLEDEAERLQVFEVEDAEARTAKHQLEAHFPPGQTLQSFVDRFGISNELLEGSLRRGMRAERYLDSRIRVQVQGGSSPAEAQSVAKELVAQLRAHADIRRLATFKREPGAVGQAPPNPRAIPAAAASGP